MENAEICLQEALKAYDFHGEVVEAVRYGSGHINDTFAVTVQEEAGRKRYILQRINSDIFTQPEKLMENILGVTCFLTKIIKEEHGDPSRETLQVYLDRQGSPCYKDSHGNYWRVYPFIEHTLCLQSVDSPQEFYECARSFGTFLHRLAHYPADTLYEVIPHFHDTQMRYENLMRAVEADVMGRKALVEKELAFVDAHKEQCDYLESRKRQGTLPLRVTHNDTKLNNILLDETTKKGLCIIDLDTIMPGLSLYDFGDSIRFGASTAAEDEVDLAKVKFDLNLYIQYVKGYLETAGDVMTPEEIRCMPWGAKLMTLECGMRFLTDYLEGDHYFKTSRENHNLDRARTQFTLVAAMEQVWEEMQIDNIRKRI